MRKLKLQMSVTLDGFVGSTDGGQDWLERDQDPDFRRFYQSEIIDPVDTLIMGRKMTAEFTAYWENIVNTKPGNADFSFAKKLVDVEKIAFSKTVRTIPGKNVRVENGDLVTEINKLKNQPGGDILVYGGANFVSSLIHNGLIDEYHFLITPTAIGTGLRIFTEMTRLRLVKSRWFQCGVVVNQYIPVKA